MLRLTGRVCQRGETQCRFRETSGFAQLQGLSVCRLPKNFLDRERSTDVWRHFVGQGWFVHSPLESRQSVAERTGRLKPGSRSNLGPANQSVHLLHPCCLAPFRRPRLVCSFTARVQTVSDGTYRPAGARFPRKLGTCQPQGSTPSS